MKVYRCIDCNNQLSKTAKECGNPSCKSSDPFGKERALKRRQTVGVILMMVIIGGFVAATHFGIITPKDVHDFITSLLPH
ncbi:hypothetical protein [Burkholderia pseudomallei]|uniref:hypothetical protein n=1 Tax=Burkholderia pseudomallei TaxID=28450 RepID=UPI000A7AFE46|nr:hypothetical protein [Burkholderia pseudomallei]